MDAKLSWEGRMTFVGAADSGHEIKLDADPSVGGDDDGPRPMELFALGLAGCTAMDVISILRKKREDVTGFEVRVHADQAEQHPKIFTRAVIEYHLTGHDLKEEALARSIELSAERYCPAQGMFNQIMPIELKYFLYADLGEGERELLTSGGYVSGDDKV